jgi:hypothetical protein
MNDISFCVSHRSSANTQFVIVSLDIVGVL